MRSLFEWSIPPRVVAHLLFAMVGLYLLFHPALVDPRSYAVFLGGALLFFLVCAVPLDALKRMGGAWWGLIGWCLLSSFWSIVPGITLQSAAFLYVGTFLYLFSIEARPYEERWVEWVGLLGAVLAAVTALVQECHGFGQLAQDLSAFQGEERDIVAAAVHNHRAFGPLTTPGALAALMILSLPQAFVRSLTASGAKKYFFLTVTLLLAAGLWSTGSLGAVLCLALSVFFVLLYAGRRDWAWEGLFGFAFLIGFLLWERGVQSWELASFSMRLDLWRSVLQLWQQHPWFGTGLGTFGEAYQRAGLDLNTGARFTHNILLQLMVETGLVGAALFLWVVADWVKRFQKPFRWEGWGVLTGAAAFFLFSFCDLPFQMPELVWIFAAVAGRLTLRAAGEFKPPSIPVRWVEYGLLAVLLAYGFWPPFRAWNLALAAVGLWSVTAYLRPGFGKIPGWLFLGAFYIGLRAFLSPSSLGAAWFLETVGLCLCFYLILRTLPEGRTFFQRFCLLGLAWALVVWIDSFRSSDIRDWRIFPNPKQVGIFLLPLFFAGARSLDLFFWRGVSFRKTQVSGWLLRIYALATFFCLKAFSAMMGLAAGAWVLVKREQKGWAVLVALCLAAAILCFRVEVFRSLDKNPTQWDRLSIWSSALKAWEENPVFGLGPGVFDGEYQRVKTPRSSGINRYLMDARYAHNEYLELLTAFGIVGFLFAGLLLYTALSPKREDRPNLAPVAALAAACFTDFCLHTPLIALHAPGLLTRRDQPDDGPRLSYVGAFLAFGISLGLFGGAFFGVKLAQDSAQLVAQGQLPQALRDLDAAQRLNAWDARVAATQAGMLESLYLSTRDPTWKRKSDEAFARVTGLEQADGQWKLALAQRLTQRLAIEPQAASIEIAQEAWRQAREALPFDAFVCLDEAVFFLHRQMVRPALEDLQKAVELEPNFAGAWMQLGIVLKAQGETSRAKAAFKQALFVHQEWKDETRASDVEKQMVSLSPEALAFLQKETKT